MEATTTKRPRRAEPALERVVGERTVLRRIMAGDLSVLHAWDIDPAIIDLMGRKFDAMTIEDWFQAVTKDRTCRTWMIETLEGRAIGELELAHLNWRNGSAELRVCIGEKDCWSQGYGTDAIRGALRVAFTEMGLQSVYLRVFVTNARAIRVYEKLGFRRQAMLEASARRQDPSAVLLMNLTRDRWHMKQVQSA